MSLLILCRGIAQQNGTAQGYGNRMLDFGYIAPFGPGPLIPGEGYEPHFSLQDASFLAHLLIARRTMLPPLNTEAFESSRSEDPTLKKKYEPTNTHL